MEAVWAMLLVFRSSSGPRKMSSGKRPRPFGHSSPVIAGDLIFLTGVKDGVRAGGENEKDKFVDRGKLDTFVVSM